MGMFSMRQTKGAAIKDDSWENITNKMKNGATLILMGSKEENIPKEVTVAKRINFVEDMDKSQSTTSSSNASRAPENIEPQSDCEFCGHVGIHELKCDDEKRKTNV